MIHRDVTEKLIHVAQKFPVITVTGPRQSGKTTLCRSIFADRAYVNLENLNHQNFALDDPLGFLSQFTEGAVIDEVQRAPKLLSFLQEIVDESQDPGRWILTGSHNLQLSSSISQSLAGRTAVIDLLPLTWREITQFSKHPQTLVEALF